MSEQCEHTHAEQWVACADGTCPLCLSAQIESSLEAACDFVRKAGLATGHASNAVELVQHVLLDVAELKAKLTPGPCRNGHAEQPMILARMCEQCGHYEDVTP